MMLSTGAAMVFEEMLHDGESIYGISIFDEGASGHVENVDNFF